MSENSKVKRSGRAWQKKIMIGALDVLAIAFCFFASLWIRFDFKISAIPHEFLEKYACTMAIWCAVSVVVFAVCKLYNSIWSFVSSDELIRVMVAYVILGAIGIVYLLIAGTTMPRSYYVVGILLSFLATAAIRFSYRLLRQLTRFFSGSKYDGSAKRIMIIGAGEAGRALVTEFETSSFIRTGWCAASMIILSSGASCCVVCPLWATGTIFRMQCGNIRFRKSFWPCPPARQVSGRRSWISALPPAARFRCCPACISW